MHARSESAPGILPLVLFLIALPAHAAAADTPVQEAGRALTLSSSAATPPRSSRE